MQHHHAVQSVVVMCLLLFGLACQGMAQSTSTFRISFTASDRQTGSPITLDSVWVRHLITGWDTTLFAPFVLDIGTATGIDDPSLATPGVLEISSNYANPFVDDTRIQIACTRSGHLTIGLHSMLGERVAWQERDVPDGSHEFVIRGRALAVSTYLLTVNDGHSMRCLRLVKIGSRGAGVPAIEFSGSSIGRVRALPMLSTPGETYRFTGHATGHTPVSVERSPIADTTVCFLFDHIPLAPEIAGFTADALSTETGRPVRFDIHATDKDADLATVLIDVDGNGVFDDSTSVTGGDATTAFTTVFTTPGTFAAMARARDARGLLIDQHLSTPVIVSQANRAPAIASFAADAYNRQTGDTVRYTVHSTDADANLSIVWIDVDGNGVFDDSTSVAGGDAVTTFTRVFTAPGIFHSLVRVADGLGLLCEQRLIAPVVVAQANRPPSIVSFIADAYTGQTGDSIRYTVRSKDADANLSTLWIDTDGDGVFDDSTTVVGGDAVTTFTWAFTMPGRHVAKARVMDDRGLMGERMLSNPVIVTPPPPAISGYTPIPICPGAEMAIQGVHFGATRGGSQVQFTGGSVAGGDDYSIIVTDCVSWTDTMIVLHAPQGMTVPGVVIITADTRTSNAFPFQLPTTPTLTTQRVTQITFVTATSGGSITDDGGCSVTARGVCWSMHPEPTVADARTTDGAGGGGFVSPMSGLLFNTTYHVRAYATNTAGTGYGDEVVFTTLGQVWMSKNLDVTTYRNGDPIPEVTDPGEWAGLTTGAWCWYNNDPALGAVYGRLYNWYAVNDPRGLAPVGWHIPADYEWRTLEISLGMTIPEADTTGWRGVDQGGKLKEQGTTHWDAPNTGATNSSGFTALGGGHRGGDGLFADLRIDSYWWTSSPYDSNSAWFRLVYYSHAFVWRSRFDNNYGFFVRCVKD